MPTMPFSYTQTFPLIGGVNFRVPGGVVIISKIFDTWTELMRSSSTENYEFLHIVMVT